MVDVKTVRKALIYIVRDDTLAVFRHRDFPEAGIQVPAGTVKPGEGDEEAALREAREETGLDDLRFMQELGRELFDFTPFGRDELHDRGFFQVACGGPTPDEWSNYEEHDGLAEPTLFDFFWMPLHDAEAALIAGHGRMVGKVRKGTDDGG